MGMLAILCLSDHYTTTPYKTFPMHIIISSFTHFHITIFILVHINPHRSLSTCFLLSFSTRIVVLAAEVAVHCCSPFLYSMFFAFLTFDVPMYYGLRVIYKNRGSG